MDILTIEDQVATFPKLSQTITQQHGAISQKNRDLIVNILS
jgi:hypothetical protein